MPKHFIIAAITLAVLLFPIAGTTRAQNAAPAQSGTAKAQAAPAVAPDDEPDHLDGWYRPVPKATPADKSGPAPVHDISGTWEPAKGWRNGVQASGAYNYPSDGKHTLPYTPAGEAAWKTHKYGDGFGSYPLEEVNDPFEMCDPIGFPRIDLHDLRAVGDRADAGKSAHGVRKRPGVARHLDGRAETFRRFSNRAGTATRLASGRIRRRSWWRHRGSMRGPGSTMRDARTRKICRWRSDFTA